MTEIQTTAEEEHWSTSKIVQDAVEQYLDHRRWQRLMLSQ
jgi:metal-responsive CopG/Arc/MetJ family transcriptional regulator